MPSRTKRAMTRVGVLLVCVLGSARVAEARQTAQQIAESMVIGQAYASGNVYVAGFVDDEPRPWPARIVGTPLREAKPGVVEADFFRIVAQSSEEQSWFPQREEGAELAERDLFATIDKAAVEDRNIARYRASEPVATALAFLAWDERLPLIDVNVRDAGRPRPVSMSERREIDEQRKAAAKQTGCTTVPQFLDDAKQLLSGTIADSKTIVRLSHYQNPGCAGHLSDIFVLDVIAPGQEPRRFEFRHYQGVL